MQWLDVQDVLPKDNMEVLVLVEGYFHKACDPLNQRIRKIIFQGTFNRRHGWHVPYCPEKHYAVVSWMPQPSYQEYRNEN